MSDKSAAKPKEPKKKIFVILTLILTLLVGANHFTFKLGYVDAEVTLTDSSAAVNITPVADTVTVADSLKK